MPHGALIRAEHLRDVRVVASEPSFAERLQPRILVGIVVLDAVADGAGVVDVPGDLRDHPRRLQHPAIREPLVGRQLQPSIPPERIVRVGDQEPVVRRIADLIVERQRAARIVGRALDAVGTGIGDGDRRELAVDQDVLDEVLVLAVDSVARRPRSSGTARARSRRSPDRCRGCLRSSSTVAIDAARVEQVGLVRAVPA